MADALFEPFDQVMLNLTVYDWCMAFINA